MLPRQLRAIVFGCHGPKLLQQERAFFGQVNPMGFILFARNVETSHQLKALCADLREAVGWNVPIFVDQEGGRVQRLRAPLATEWPAPLDHAEQGDAAAIYDRYYLISQELLSYGIDVNCAPCLDIARAETHPFLQNRCLGRDLETVVTMGRAAVLGHLDAGVVPVIKHMPGHGLAQIDSHKALPTVDLDRETLLNTDFAAFRAFADAPMAMTAHIVFSCFDRRPATISDVMIATIRQDMGFNGFLLSDDLSMQALPGAIEMRASASINAGCDAALHCNGLMAEMERVADHVPNLTPLAYDRADRALSLRSQKRPSELDIKELSAKLLGR